MDEFSFLCHAWVLVASAYSMYKQVLCSGLRFLQMCGYNFSLDGVRDNSVPMWMLQFSAWQYAGALHWSYWSHSMHFYRLRTSGLSSKIQRYM